MCVGHKMFAHIYLYFFLNKKYTIKNNGQSGGAIRWRVCYQRGLPHLVYISLNVILELAFVADHGQLQASLPISADRLPVRGGQYRKDGLNAEAIRGQQSRRD